jgi:cytochrome P450
VSTADRPIFRSASDAIMSTSVMTPQERSDAMGELATYMATMVQERRVTPTDDLLSALVVARDGGDRLSEGELLELGITILVAGHETTMSSIGNMTYTLLTRQRLWEELRDHPESVEHAVDELLRYTPLIASAGFRRVAVQDVELSGETVRAGETVVVSLNAANRDPARFADAESLLLDRTDNRRIAFGHGPHHCPGAALARMELQEFLKGLLRDFPDHRLVVAPDDVDWRMSALVRGPKSLPLTWGP